MARMFIATFTTARYPAICSDRSIQATST